MSYLKPDCIVDNMIKTGAYKSQLGFKDIFIRGSLCGAFLAYATSFAYMAEIQTKPIIGALLFPVGVALIILFGMELLTGNFALLPSAFLDKKCSAARVFRNWALVFVSNFFGSVLYGVMFTIVLKGHFNNPALVQKFINVAEGKTIAYAHMGSYGLLVAFVSAVLCNWMVTLGTIIPYCSSTTSGKIMALWLPIMTFFALGYEHTVVNMFVIPTGIMLGANVTLSDWWLWNQIPVTLGNLLGGAVFTATAFYLTYVVKGETKQFPIQKPALLVKGLEGDVASGQD
ncbi:MAG: formate/nitrite transporter family protein [Deltaproteobacteria bacterium]|nr:formate/nitrite transporter family protein [Deltaproteobacteria bacterium]